MKKLLMGISAGIFYTLLSIVISLLSAPYFLNYISKEEYGVYFLINNLIVWTGLVNVGLRGSFKLQLSAAVAKGEKTESLTSTAFIAQCFIALLICTTGFILSYFHSLFIYSISSEEIQSVFMILTVSFSISLISNPIASILSVHNHDFNIYSTRSILLVLQVMISVFLLTQGSGIMGLSIAAVLCEIGFFCYTFYLVKSRFSLAHFHFSAFEKNLLWSSLSLGKWFLVGFLAQLLLRHTDLILIERFAGLNTITAFIFSSKLYVLATALLLMIFKIATPQLTKLNQSEGRSEFSADMSMIFLKFIVGFIAIFGTGIYMLNETFVNWWVGESFYLGDKINLMVMLAFLFASFNQTVRTLHISQMRLKPQKLSALIEGTLHISLSLILGIFYQLDGIVTGIVISSGAACFISVYSLLDEKVSFSKIKKDLTAMALFIFFTTLIVLAVSYSPSVINGFFAMIAIAISFILLFLKDVRMVTTKIFKINFKNSW